MTETPREALGAPASEPPEAQRSLTSDTIAYALGAVTSDVVSDVYGSAKAAVKHVVAKIKNEPPKAPDPPVND
jgi:hypothetical protein